jgi:hypothetical protein
MRRLLSLNLGCCLSSSTLSTADKPNIVITGWHDV